MLNGNQGTIYQVTDYIGFWKRVAIQILDLLVIFVVMIPFLILDNYRYDNYYSESFLLYSYLGLFICYLYLTMLKASRFGTLGQLVTKTIIRTIHGDKPSMLRMTYRLLFWILGPFNVITDMAFIPSNSEKRTLRDCLCKTILVKKNVVPISTGAKIRNIRVMFMGFYLLYQSAHQ